MAFFVVNSDGRAKDYERFSSKRTVWIGPNGDVLPLMEHLAGLVQGR